MRKAIVMAGRRGSRLWPLTLTRPKPLVSVSAGAVIGSGCFLAPGTYVDGEQRLAPDQVVSGNLRADVRSDPPRTSAPFASLDGFVHV